MMDPGTGHLVERAALLSRSHQLLATEGDTVPTVHAARELPELDLADAPAPAAASVPPARATLPQAPAEVGHEPAPIVSAEMMERAGMVVVGSTRSRVIEEWRVIVAALSRRQPRRGTGTGMSNVLMVTSSRAREGKSFCSLNLAATVAKNRKTHTVLVDIDAKRNATSELLGLAGRPGLLNMVAQPSLKLEDVLVATELPFLSILPLGSHSGAGSDSGITQPVVVTLERIARQLPDRLLVLDTAPCLATSDASTLSAFVGQVAVIVEAELTQKVDLESTLSLISSCETVSLVLNKARGQSSGHFGTGYFGYYDQGS